MVRFRKSPFINEIRREMNRTLGFAISSRFLHYAELILEAGFEFSIQMFFMRLILV